LKGTDEKGYYRVLGLSPGADAGQIKAAYRRRAKETHPDKNRAIDTTKEFQRVAEAYAVLSDPVKKAQYDTPARDIPPASHRREEEAPSEPIRCSSCNRVTAQPRFVIFLEVTSFVFFARKSGVQGIYCANCAWKKALGASTLTWFAGWWSFHGFFWTLEALAKNLFGGIKPVHANARLLGYQAWWFATQRQFEIARALAVDAMKLAAKASDSELMGMLGSLLKQTDDGKPVARLKNRWSPFNGAFVAQAALASLVIGSIWGAMEWERFTTRKEWEQVAARSTRPAAALPSEQKSSVHASPVPKAPRLVPPDPVPKAPRLVPRPTPANGVFDLYWTDNSEPRAPFRVVTPQGSENYFVKLVDAITQRTVMTIFVHGGRAAEVDVPLGSYRMKYAAGRIWYGDKLLFGPDTIYSQAETIMRFRAQGNQLLGHSVELILRRHGNLKTTRIRPADF